MSQFLKAGGGLSGLSMMNQYNGGLDLGQASQAECMEGTDPHGTLAGPYTRELPPTMRIAVHGYGRLSQYSLAKAYGEGPPSWDTGTLGGILYQSEFQILSGAIELSSRGAAPRTPRRIRASTSTTSRTAIAGVAERGPCSSTPRTGGRRARTTTTP